jgi:hypothetical protein
MKALKLETAAAQYDFEVSTLRTACLLGRVKATKIGKCWYVRPEEMERLISEGYRKTKFEEKQRRQAIRLARSK